MTFPRGSTRSAQTLKAGDLVGNYRIDSEISSGGMGTVHRATHVILQRRAAIKILHADLLEVPSASERMLQEARILEAMAHPAFVRLWDAGTLSDGRPWVAMELIEGQTLADRSAEAGALLLTEVARVLVQLCEALMQAHRLDIVHRDVKPENILLVKNERGDGDTIKLIDWGIAQVAQSPQAPRFTQVDLVPGTPHYLAPELLRGEDATSAVDTYSLGVVAYELLVGEPPFAGENAVDIAYQHLHSPPTLLRASRPDLPVWLEQLVAAMMDKQPADRPSLHLVQAALMKAAFSPTKATATPIAMPVRSAVGNPSISITPRPIPTSNASHTAAPSFDNEWLDEEELAPVISIEGDEGGYYYDELAVGA